MDWFCFSLLILILVGAFISIANAAYPIVYVPFNEYPANWYFAKDHHGMRVPVSNERQADLEYAQQYPVLLPLQAKSLLPEIKLEDRIFIKHPWKNS